MTEHETIPRNVSYHGRAGSHRLAKACAVFVVFHLLMTALYLGPTPGPIRSLATRYMEPVFKQNWGVFAPDPVSSNVYLLVRGTKSDGSRTPWFNITQCDIDSAIHHHPVPDRRYLTTFQLVRHYELWRKQMPDKAKNTLAQNATGTDWPQQIEHRLTAAGASEHVAKEFVKSNRVVDYLLTDVARARWGNVRNIQMQIKTVHTRPFAQRNTKVALKTEVWQPGTFPAAPAPSEDEQKTMAKLYGPSGGC